jgi:probable phosphoglycerate mutase
VPASEIWLVRHGETEWAKSGRHTGLRDLTLTLRGEEQAVALRPHLSRPEFTVVAVSPLRRARQTCDLAGFAGRAETWPETHEWDYGAFEGLTSADIGVRIPGWNIWRHGVEGGETVEQVGARADRTLARVEQVSGRVLLFAHGHFLRILTCRWLGLSPSHGRLFAFRPAAVSVLGWEGDIRVIRSWNRDLSV